MANAWELYQRCTQKRGGICARMDLRCFRREADIHLKNYLFLCRDFLLHQNDYQLRK
jgi:hypothetical protein